MSLIVAGFLSAIVLWVIGDILDRIERARRDREHAERWGKKDPRW